MNTGSVPYLNARTSISTQTTKDVRRRSSASSAQTVQDSSKHTVPVESTITRLLVATKQLLEGLAKWSRGETTEEEISVIYVKLGNEFNTACMAFAKEDIGMSELLSVPSDLRVCLETCLSDEPSQATLEQHLPKVRQIIIGLLHGLREKQRQYRENTAARRDVEKEGRDKAVARSQRESEPSSSDVRTSVVIPDRSGVVIPNRSRDSVLTPNAAAKSREDLKKFVAQTQTIQSGRPRASVNPLPQHPPEQPIPTASRTQPTNEQDLQRFDRGSEQGPPLRTSSMSGMRQLPSTSKPPRSDRRGYSLDPSSPPATALQSVRMESDLSSQASFMTANSADNGRISSRSSDSSDSSIGGYHGSATTGHSTSSPLAGVADAALPKSRSFTSNESDSLKHNAARLWEPPTLEVGADLPSLAKDSTSVATVSHNNTIRPASIQSVLSDQEQIFNPTIEGSMQSAAQKESLAALKSSDNLSRRASKRFSAYAIQKMTTGTSPAKESPTRTDRSERGEFPRSSVSAGRELAQRSQSGAEELKSSATPERSPRKGKSEFRPARGHEVQRRDAPPPVPAIPASLSNPDIHSTTVQTIVEEEESPPPPIEKTPIVESHRLRKSSREKLLSWGDKDNIPSVPSPSTSLSSEGIASPIDKVVSTGGTGSVREPEFPISIYLQIGKEVKKASLEEMPTIAALRVLFIERFQYNPGHSDFPNIYVRDPVIGVHYELEDMNEVKNGSVISLNIDSVEVVKQHIDQGLSTLAQDIKELRSTVTQMRRASVPAAAFFSPGLNASPSMMMAQVPSERQYEEAAKKVLDMKLNTPKMTSPRSPPLIPAVPMDNSVDRAATSSPEDQRQGQDIRQIVGTLKTQHDEVTSLRREIGVLRQIYSDFASQTKTMFSTVRTQTSHVQNLAATKVSTARAFINAGKGRLETDTETLIVKGDDLQDSIEQMREDILKKIRPRPGQINEISNSLQTTSKKREELVAWIGTVKPSWKATWSDELETIINEQKQLDTAESLLEELGVDLGEAAAVLANIQQVSKQPKSSRSVKEFVPMTATDDHQGLTTVLLEVQALEPDPYRRLEAIAKAEKQRELDLASRTDEFADELGGFVSGRKLKKSGGIEEAERLRQARSEATLKAMFANPASASANSTPAAAPAVASEADTSVD